MFTHSFSSSIKIFSGLNYTVDALLDGVKGCILVLEYAGKRYICTKMSAIIILQIEPNMLHLFGPQSPVTRILVVCRGIRH